MPIATLSIDLVAKLASIERDMGKAAHIAESNAKRMEDAFSKAGTAIKAVFGGIALSQTWQRFVTDVANAEDAMSKLATRTGVSVNALSKLDYAVRLNGASTADLEHGLKGLSSKLFDAAKGGKESGAIFSALGISVRDAGGAIRPVEHVFNDLADRFAGMEDGAAKSAFSMNLMGEAGTRLIPVLNNGSAGLAKLGGEAERLGVAMKDASAKAAADFNDNLTRLEATSTGLARSIGNSLIPAINDLAGEFFAAQRSGLGFWESVFGIGLRGTDPGEQINDLRGEIEALNKEIERTPMRITPGAEAARVAGLREEIELRQKLLDYYREIQARDALKTGGEDVKDRRIRLEGEAAAAKKLAATLDTIGAASAKAAGPAEHLGDATEFMKHAMKGLDGELKNVSGFLDDVARSQAEGERSATAALDAIMKTIDARTRENEEIGLSRDALSRLRTIRLDAAAAAKEQTAADLDAIAPGSHLAELYRQQAEALRELAAVQRDGDVKRASTDSAEHARDEWERISNDISRSLTDAILAGGSSGWDLLKRQIQATAIQATVVPLVQGGVNTALQSFGFGPGAGGAGLGTLGSLGALGAFGTGLGAAGTAVGAVGFGGTLSAAGSLIGTGTAGGIGAGLGMGAGAIAPYALAAYLVADSLGAFKGSTPHRGGAATSSGGIASLATNSTLPGFGLDWGAFRSDRSASVDSAVTTVVSGLDNTLTTMLAALGVSGAGISVSGRFASDNDDPSIGALRISRNGETIADTFGKFSKDATKGFQEFAQDSERALLHALRALADDVDPMITGLLEAVDPAVASLDTVRSALAAVGEATGAQSALEQFGDIDVALETVRRAGLDATAQFYLLGDELRAAARAGSMSSQEIVSTLQTRYAAELEMLRSIDVASKSIGASFDDAIRGIRFSVLESAGQYEFLDAEASRYLDTLKTLTDPGLIADYAGKLQNTITQAFGLLDGGEQKRLAEDFVSRLREAEDVAQGRLAASRDQALANQYELAGIMKDALREVFSESGKVLELAASKIPAKVQIDHRFTADVPGKSEVGFSD